MKIDRIILRFVRIPLRFEFQNRWQRIRSWTKLIVELRSGDGVGYGECMAMETPFYSYENIDTAWWVITNWLARPLLEGDFSHPREVAEAFSLIHGHHEGKAALECAFWDLYARSQGVPLCEAIGGRRRPVSAGSTVGIQKDIETIVKVAGVSVTAGYKRLKVKIKPGWDTEPLAALRAAYPGLTLLADANGAYSGKDIDMLAGLERFAPIIIEQPFPAGSWTQFAALQARTSTIICLDEAIDCFNDVEQMIHFKAARMVNIKVGRVGGIVESIRIHDRCAEAGIPVFVGSKIETGIGRWMNIAVATLGNVCYPSDVSASERYFVEETVCEPIKLVSPGFVEPLPGPGIGTEIVPERILKYTIRTLAIPE